MSQSQGGFYLLGKKLRNLKSSWPFAAEDRRFALGMASPSLQTTIHVPLSNLWSVSKLCFYLLMFGKLFRNSIAHMWLNGIWTDNWNVEQKSLVWFGVLKLSLSCQFHLFPHFRLKMFFLPEFFFIKCFFTWVPSYLSLFSPRGNLLSSTKLGAP